MKKLLLIGTLFVGSASPVLALPLKQYAQMVSDYQTALESKNDALALEILANIEAEAINDKQSTVWTCLEYLGLNRQAIEIAKVELAPETTVLNPLFSVSAKNEVAQKDVRPWYKKKRYVITGLAALAGTGALFVDYTGQSK